MESNIEKVKTGRKPTHGHHCRGKRSKEHIAWSHMIQRCTNPNTASYKHYGGRGVKVCEEWSGVNGFANFLRDMGEKPTPRHSLDRFPNNETGMYEKSNCRWATPYEQQSNRRDNVYITHQGERKTISEWSRHLGISISTISGRMKLNLPVYMVLFTRNQNKK